MLRIASLLSLCLAVVLGAAQARAGALETVDQIEACMEGNQPGGSSIQTVVVRSTDRVGSVTRMKSKIYWQEGEGDKNKVLMRFDDPPDMRGSSLLLLEKDGRNDMFMYLPELDRVRRITSHMMSGSMFGTDFSYEDFERLQGMSEDAKTERVADGEVAGRGTYVLLQEPGADSEYSKVVTHVDHETCVTLRMELFERGDEPRKVMEAQPESIQQEGSVWMARQMTIRDLRDETSTSMEIEELELGVELSRATFSQRNLARGR